MMKRSSNGKASSGRQTGSGDGIIDMLRHHNIPITRQNYRELAYMGEVSDKLSAEEGVNLPPMLRRLKR